VGTGFSPELTGRDNIFLNGAILGMNHQEIIRKFDEIVAFAEVDKFLDTPVKYYSSGMYVRLAFAVAAHLEPEILVVDEVLAVGDAAFQKKCLGKMGDVAREGRTVLFVSHNMFAIRGLSKRAILIAEGQVQCSGDVDMVIERYLTREMEDLPNEIDTSNWKRSAEGLATDLKVTKVCLCSRNGETRILSGKPFIAQMDIVVTRPVEEVVYGYAVFSLDGIRLFQCHNTNEGQPHRRLDLGKYRVTAIVDNLPLPPGRYRLGIGVRCNAKGLDWIEELMLFEVEESQEIKSPWFKAVDGLFRQYSRWKVEVLS
jgi:lipopolysaccharide transport system ATP-binding protein